MLKKTFRRFGALVMVMALAVSVFAVNAFAVGVTGDGNNPITSITLTKKLTPTNADALAPSATATFSVSPAEQETTKTVGTGKDAKTYAVKKGVDGGLKFDTGKDTVTFTQNDVKVTNQNYFQQTTSLTVDATKFETPGIYRYVVTETSVTGDGVTKDSTTYNVDLYVEWMDISDETKLAVKYAECVNTSDEKSDLVFNNNYESYTLTVAKNVTGSLGDKSHKWQIQVTINGGSGEQYKTNYTGSDNEVVTLTSGTPYTFKLADSESVSIYGLSANDTYTVTETDELVQADHYTVTGEVKEATKLTKDTTVTITNALDSTTPTGVITTVAPYALMLVVAGAFAVVFLTRRNRAE